MAETLIFLVVITILGLSILLHYLVGRGFQRLLRPLTQRSNIADREGQEVEKTMLAKTGYGALQLDAALIASAGANSAAPMTIDDHILRPTIGVRAISLIGSCALFYLIWFGREDLLPVTDWVKLGLTTLLIYAMIYTFSYELRYNRDLLIGRGMAFNRREHRWRDLQRIRDNGHYMFVLNFEDGRRLEVPKHLVGMPDFLSVANRHVAENNAAEPPKSSPIRRSRSVFGTRKTFT